MNTDIRCTAMRFIAIASAFLILSAANYASADGGLPSGGTLFLDLGTVDEFRWVKPDASIARQSVSDLRDSTGSSKDACKLALGADPTRNIPLVTVAGVGGTAGFNKQKDWIGVREQSRGVDCGRVSPGQALKVTLAGDLAGYAVKHTELQINLKQNAVIKAVVTFRGQNPQTFWLKSGLSATGTPAANETFCNAGVSDSNPDVRSNCVWPFDGLYNEATFTTNVVGEWSLAAAAAPSLFALVKADGILDCSDSRTTITAGNGTDSATVQGARNANADGSACIAVPYSLTSTCDATSCVTDFRYELFGQNAMAFFFRWTWPLEAIPLGGVNTIPLTQQFFGNGAGPVDLDFCPGTTAVFDGFGEFVRLDGELDDQDGDIGNGVQAGCLIRRETLQLDEGAVISEDAYVRGDYISRRG